MASRKKRFEKESDRPKCRTVRLSDNHMKIIRGKGKKKRTLRQFVMSHPDFKKSS